MVQNSPNSHSRRLVVVGMLIGVGMFIVGVADDGRIDASDCRSFGVMIVILVFTYGLAMWLQRPATTAYTLGHTEGYQQGYVDGRRVARPIVVPITPDAARHRDQMAAADQG